MQMKKSATRHKNIIFLLSAFFFGLHAFSGLAYAVFAINSVLAVQLIVKILVYFFCPCVFFSIFTTIYHCKLFSVCEFATFPLCSCFLDLRCVRIIII